MFIFRECYVRNTLAANCPFDFEGETMVKLTEKVEPSLQGEINSSNNENENGRAKIKDKPCNSLNQSIFSARYKLLTPTMV